MLLGEGLLARAFAPVFQGNERVVVFASGVSDSQCTIAEEFDREVHLLQASISKYAHADAFLYFSTCSIFDPCSSGSPYVVHKLRMEDLVARHRAHLVLRLPVVVGSGGNRKSLVRFLAERIVAEEPFEVWKNAGRYLIDIDDVVRICVDLVNTEMARNERINVAGPSDVLLPELVELLARIVGKRPICTYVARGARFSLDTHRISESVSRLNVPFDAGYVERVLRKYYGSAGSS